MCLWLEIDTWWFPPQGSLYKAGGQVMTIPLYNIRRDLFCSEALQYLGGLDIIKCPFYIEKTPRARSPLRITDSILSTTSEIQEEVDLPFLKACWCLDRASTTPISSRYHTITRSIPLSKKEVREIGRKDRGEE